MRALVLICALAVWTGAGLAQTQDPQALYDAGLRYHDGQGVVQDYARAAALMEQAAQAGHPGAQAHLGG